MGIDLKAGGRVKKNNRTEAKSNNVYLQLLIKLFKFLSRRVDSNFNKAILRRLCSSRINRPPISLSRLSKHLRKHEGKVAVVVGTVTDDIRLLEVPKMEIAALRFTETARARIIKAGGKCLTLDQLALQCPTGKNTVLLRGPKDRVALRYFGAAPGVPGSHTRPRVRDSFMGHKHESASGARKPMPKSK